jgi:Asp-tRNA(Asn)/Glu-tRNA(Gln) amidotransferase A subunit family amidase
MELRDYTACDATELRRVLAAGEVSVGEVREAALRAIEAVEPRLNLVTHCWPAQARTDLLDAQIILRARLAEHPRGEQRSPVLDRRCHGRGKPRITRVGLP